MTASEVYLLFALGNLLGLLPTVGLIFLTAASGAALARREGARVWLSWQQSLARGEMPEEGIVGGVLVLAGSIFLMTPGVLTDAFGLALLLPPSRRWMARHVRKYLRRRVDDGSIQYQATMNGFRVHTPTSRGVHQDGPRVVEVNAERVEEQRRRMT